jgi:DNA-binding response OmpR family regulator
MSFLPDFHDTALRFVSRLKQSIKISIKPRSNCYTARMNRTNVLLVDDDADLSKLIAKLLNAHAIDTTLAASIADAKTVIAKTNFDALVLDIMLPDGSGLDLCRELRMQRISTPVLMLSARGDTFDRVLGLEIGADDYLAKPFEASELVARVRALVRRIRLAAEAAEAPQSLREYGTMRIDMLSRRVAIDGQHCELTANEFKLLTILAEHVGEPMTRNALSRATQPGAYMPSDRSVDVQITRLRKKLREAGSTHDWISTVRGEGYVFTLPTRTP